MNCGTIYLNTTQPADYQLDTWEGDLGNDIFINYLASEEENPSLSSSYDGELDVPSPTTASAAPPLCDALSNSAESTPDCSPYTLEDMVELEIRESSNATDIGCDAVNIFDMDDHEPPLLRESHEQYITDSYSLSSSPVGSTGDDDDDINSCLEEDFAACLRGNSLHAGIEDIKKSMDSFSGAEQTIDDVCQYLNIKEEEREDIEATACDMGCSEEEKYEMEETFDVDMRDSAEVLNTTLCEPQPTQEDVQHFVRNAILLEANKQYLPYAKELSEALKRDNISDLRRMPMLPPPSVPLSIVMPHPFMNVPHAVAATRQYFAFCGMVHNNPINLFRHFPPLVQDNAARPIQFHMYDHAETNTRRTRKRVVDVPRQDPATTPVKIKREPLTVDSPPTAQHTENKQPARLFTEARQSTPAPTFAAPPLPPFVPQQITLRPELLMMRQRDAAKALGVSTSSLCKKWRQSMGNRPWPYRTHRRLEKEISTKTKKPKI